MTKITAKFNIVTPLFMSGANLNDFELRGASFKGLLRFWWRALAYNRHKGELKEIHAEECRLFGSSDNGQGSFLLRVREEAFNNSQILNVGSRFVCEPNRRVGAGMIYLGYGIVENNGNLKRPCLIPPSSFTIELLFKVEPEPSVIDALKLLGLLGGIGSRSRRGYGSLSLEAMEGAEWRAPVDVDSYQKEIQELLKNQTHDEPSYTAFSTKSRIALVNSDAPALSLLDQIGINMQKYRSWRQEGNFKDDHDLVLYATQGICPKCHPDRVAFGLPHNYFFSNPPRPNIKVSPENYERRASPLTIHIHKFSDTSFAGIISILPAQFLPEDEKIKVHNHLVDLVANPVDFTHLHKFIDGLEGPRLSKSSNHYFPHRVNIYP